MLVKGVVDEDFVNYKLASMFVICHSCNFKCDKLFGKPVCQNGSLASLPDIDISIQELVERYLNNPITKAVVFGGLEPFDDADNVVNLIFELRKRGCGDNVVIYTGYTEDEIRTAYKMQYQNLIDYGNVVIKYGRYIPNSKERYDDILGVKLQSDNQYAKVLSQI